MGHISTVNKRTIGPSINYGFLATTGNMGSLWYKTLSDLFADALSTRPGDKVFFQITGKDPRTNSSLNQSDKPEDYTDLINTQKDVKVSPHGLGFIGTFEITGKPFFDTDTKISITSKSVVEESIPIRIPIKCKEFLPVPVSEDRAFNDPTDPGNLWNPKFRKTLFSAKSLTSISPEEAKKLRRMIYKKNDRSYTVDESQYPGNGETISINERLNQDESISVEEPNNIESVSLDDIPFVSGDEFKVEKALEAWLMEMIDSDQKNIRRFLGPKEEMEWFCNYAPYGMAGSNIDALIFHRRNEIRYKISVIELKKGKGSDVVEQVLDYSNWVSDYLAQGDKSMVQPIVIAGDFQHSDITATKYYSGSRKPQLIKYTVCDEEVILREVS